MPAAILLATAVAIGVASAVAANASIAAAPAHVYQTEIVDVTVPATQDSYSPIKITGEVKAKTGSEWAGAGSVDVTIYYRISSKVSWGKIGIAKTNSRGAFVWRHGMIVTFGHKQWQARIARQQVGNSLYQASASGIKSTLFGAQTSFGSISYTYNLAGGATLVLVNITSDYVTSNFGYAPVQGTARFYYLPKGKKTWIYEGSDSTDTAGTVEFFYYHANGHIRIDFPSQGIYLGSSVTAPIG